MSDLIDRQAAIDLFPNDDLESETKGGYIAPHLARQMICELPSAQPDSKETSSTHKALDTISRQAVIEINRSYHGQMPNEVNHRIWKEINELPSAQPETHDKRTETHTCDLISRKAAVDSICRTVCDNPEICESPCDEIKVLETMPSAQPDLSGYSDRLWKAAYERGKVEAQRKKGKWIEYDNSHCECPFCHEEWSYFDNEVECFNYCPNCGAEMEGQDA